MSNEAVIYDKQGHVALLTLNRPQVLNALNHDLHEGIAAGVAQARADDDVRALIITGAGRGFCSGADLSRRTPADPLGTAGQPESGQNEKLDDLQWFGRQNLAIHALDKPVIAAVNGIAVGAGMSLALCCDLRVGSGNARFRTIFLERAISPDSSLSFMLPRVIGYAKAMDLILTSREVDAAEAHRLGLLDRLVEHHRLIEEALVLADQIARWPPLAIRAAKRVTQQNLNVGLEDALRNESRHLAYSRRAPNDIAEMLAARAEKRAGVYTGT